MRALTGVRAGPDGPLPLLILDQRPDLAVRRDPDEHPDLTAPDGSIVWAGECGQPRPWRELITRTSRCAVLIGAIGLWPSSSERDAPRIQTRLDRAAQAGGLAGGLVEACC